MVTISLQNSKNPTISTSCGPDLVHCRANTILRFTEIRKKTSDELFGGKIIPLKYIIERTAVTVTLCCAHSSFYFSSTCSSVCYCSERFLLSKFQYNFAFVKITWVYPNQPCQVFYIFMVQYT